MESSHVCKLNIICLLLLVICILITFAVDDSGFPCKIEEGLCGCVYTNGTGQKMVIDMSALDKKGEPYFKKIDGDAWIYDLNLCTRFTLEACKDVTGCQINAPGQPKNFFPIAEPGSESFSNYNPDQTSTTPSLVVTYHAGTRTTILSLYCTKEDDQATFIDENPPLTYKFNVKSTHLCPFKKPNPTNKPSSGSGSPSTGTILVIVFFVVVVVYLISGTLFMKYRRGATGKEIIPNVNFWSSLPGLVKDGCVFSFKKMKGLCERGCRREGYSEI